MLTLSLSRSQKGIIAAREQNLTARERLYPSAPSLGLPLSLPLIAYAGIYTHPAYPDLSITLSEDNKPALHATFSSSLTARMTLEHVTSEFFLATLFLFVATVEPTAVVRAEYQVNAKGKVARFGICLDFQDMPDTLIWFDRSN